MSDNNAEKITIYTGWMYLMVKTRRPIFRKVLQTWNFATSMHGHCSLNIHCTAKLLTKQAPFDLRALIYGIEYNVVLLRNSTSTSAALLWEYLLKLRRTLRATPRYPVKQFPNNGDPTHRRSRAIIPAMAARAACPICREMTSTTCFQSHMLSKLWQIQFQKYLD